MEPTYLYVLSLIVSGLLLLLSIFFIITLSDLECDYLNPTECCDRLNQFIVPRIIATVVMLLLNYMLGNWYMLVFNGIFLAYLLYQRFWVPSGKLGVYDPTEIYNRGQVRDCIRDCILICGWFLLNFFLEMYLGILNALKGGEDPEVAEMEVKGIPYNSSI